MLFICLLDTANVSAVYMYAVHKTERLLLLYVCMYMYARMYSG